MAKKKHKKKNRPVPCSDANQHVKEHNANVRKQNDYLIKKLAEYRAKRMAAAGMAPPTQPSTTTITEPSNSYDTSSETIFN